MRVRRISYHGILRDVIPDEEELLEVDGARASIGGPPLTAVV